MMVTKGMQREIALRALKEGHEMECAQMRQQYAEYILSIQMANMKLMEPWNAATAANLAEHARRCMAVDAENRVTLAPWEAAKAKIKVNHERITQEIQESNRRVLLSWEAENAARLTTYHQACRKIELENQRLTSAWDALTASRQAEHRQKCDEIDAKNRQIVAEWETENAPWLREQRRWHDCAVSAEAAIKRLEAEFIAQRSMCISKFQQRKISVESVLSSHEGARQDYERELRQAEMNSNKLQLEEHLDKYLIRSARLKGITGDRILSLESFWIETAKDVAMLQHQKVPGIGPVLSKRLFDWRDKLASSFKPRAGLPESERKRVASRYGPVLLPLRQALRSAIDDLEAIAASHRASEVKRIDAIAAAVQELAVAQANVQAMRVL